MPRSALKLAIPLACLILLLFAVFHKEPRKPDPETGGAASDGAKQFDPSRFLVRPFHGEKNQVALALDGGALPIAKGEAPSVEIGENAFPSAHLAWVHDWTHADCRTSFKNLQALYASEQGASLPVLKIYLNPVFSDPAGEAVHRAMLQVLFRSRVRNNYLTLASELSSGRLSPDAEAIRKRVEDLDPILIDDWSAELEWLENDITKTFATARLQQARNTAVLGSQSPAQLSSMRSILPPPASSQEITDFLKDAQNTQRDWLQKLQDLSKL